MRTASTCLLFLACSCATSQATSRADQPNVVLIYADDIGYGDFSCYGATRVKTPHVDKIAAEGLRFTDAHCAAATCTPSRYAMLTGEYAWRRKGTGVLSGEASMIIEPGRKTLATLFKQAGYATAVVGKWHLGLGAGNVDWNQEITPGPREIGFDYSFLIPATGDRVPCVYVENQRVVGLDPADPIEVSYRQPIGNDPTGRENPSLLKVQPSHGHDQTIVNGISRIGYMTGGKAARWVDEDMADVITRKAVDYIAQGRQEPFFLYFSTHDIHVPRAPHPRFVGQTEMGPRGDAIAQFDWCVGQVVEALQKKGVYENTLLIVTSDNGPVIDDGYQDDAVSKLGDHRAAGPFRGGKYSQFEGGTRVPFLVRWPGHVKPGTSSVMISQLDLIPSLAALLDQPLAASAAPDGMSLLPALLGESSEGRDHFVHHAGNLALRDGPWKYIPPGKGARVLANTNTESGADPEAQLYNLDSDPGERNNLASQNPDRLKAMADHLEAIRQSTRTRPDK